LAATFWGAQWISDSFSSVPHPHSTAQAQTNLASYKASEAAVTVAKENLRVAQAQQQAATAQVYAAQVQNAELQLSYYTIVAPISGRIAQRTVQTGNRVSVGQALMAVVEDCGSQHRRYRESDRQTL